MVSEDRICQLRYPLLLLHAVFSCYSLNALNKALFIRDHKQEIEESPPIWTICIYNNFWLYVFILACLLLYCLEPPVIYIFAKQTLWQVLTTYSQYATILLLHFPGRNQYWIRSKNVVDYRFTLVQLWTEVCIWIIFGRVLLQLISYADST